MQPRTLSIRVLLACSVAIGIGGLALGAGWRAAGSSEEGSGGAWLGILIGEALDGGVQIVAVVPGGPAERAGLQGGDVLGFGQKDPEEVHRGLVVGEAEELPFGRAAVRVQELVRVPAPVVPHPHGRPPPRASGSIPR